MKKLFYLVMTFCLLGSVSAKAQVTIGSEAAPTRATLLDLKTRQAAGVVNNVGDNENISSTTGGLLLPRVKLVNTNTLQPFIPTTDAEWTNATKQKALRMSLAGLMVYNIATVGSSLYPGLYTWDGEKWTTSQVNPSPIGVLSQPKAFTFYETGTGTVQPLVFGISGGSGSVTYQWYQITGNNLHVRVGTKVTAGTGGTTASYTPTQVLKGTTKDARNTGFYRFYCVAKDANGVTLESDIAEIAVGCGAKNNLGEWISFMCFNLGADNNSTIASQKAYAIGSFTNATDGKHAYISGEEKLYGDLFQWGRIADGHEKRESTVKARGNMTTDEIGGGKRCSTTDASRPYHQIKKTSDWYGKFITTNAAQDYNWNPVAQATADVLWRSSRFIYNDPCAHYKTDGTYQAFWHEGTDTQNNGDAACTDAGTAWRIPTQAEWGEIYKGGTLSGHPSVATANTWVWNSANGRGFEIRPDGTTTTLFLPANGSRNSGSGLLYAQGSNGYYWSASIIGTNTYNVNFHSGVIYTAHSFSRATGLAVRCIKN